MNLQKYNADQRKIMACMAYAALTLWNKATIDGLAHESTEFSTLRQSIEFSAFCAANIGVSDDDTWEIRRGNIKGLQNLNRMGSVQYFEDNYTFDPYGEYGVMWAKSQKAA